MAFNKQVRQLSPDIRERECGLIEIGRSHARKFDGGHSPSGGGVERVLAQLRRLAQREEREAAKVRVQQPATPVKSDLDELRARRANRSAPTG
jgi:hypothetical protein